MGLLHHAGAGVRQDQSGVSEGCAGVWILDISKNNNRNVTMMDYCLLQGVVPIPMFLVEQILII